MASLDEPAAALPSERDAYALLSTPVAQIDDAKLEAICADLRRRRELFLQGVADKPARKPAVPVTPEQKAANAAEIGDLLKDLKI